ncbi:MAG: glucose-6-phosphate dehydrogenase [Geminicoccaceae bacterium]
MLEKPIGRDLASARAINDAVGEVFEERQIFRIDHYLGKETVQNLRQLRFANALFEPFLWNLRRISTTQITVAESPASRGGRPITTRPARCADMVQNHPPAPLLLVAMEPPHVFAAEAVRNEKLKVLRSLRPIDNGDVMAKTVRGQYQAGAVNGQAVPGYLTELDRPASSTETFVVIKAEIANWRWAGVPFYLRTGKRMMTRQSEIVIQFKAPPYSIFGEAGGPLDANRLVVRLQPDEAVRLFLMSKDPGPGGMRLRTVPLNLAYADAFNVRYPDAYERLLLDVVRGNATLFMHKDEVEAAWTWVEPILRAWEARNDPPKPYTAGSWGPSAAIALIERDGRNWLEDAA